MLSFFSDDLEAYIAKHSELEPSFLAEVAQFTREKTTSPTMLSGHIVGRFLKMLVRLTKSKNVLEIGTFTGYATLSLAEGVAPFSGKVTTLEFDKTIAKKANSFFEQSDFASNIELKVGPAIESLESLKGPFDLVFIDADKVNYIKYFHKLMNDLVQPGSLLVFDNCLWSGAVLDPKDASSRAICELNEALIKDPRVDNLLLSIRDGLHLALVK